MNEIIKIMADLIDPDISHRNYYLAPNHNQSDPILTIGIVLTVLVAIMAVGVLIVAISYYLKKRKYDAFISQQSSKKDSASSVKSNEKAEAYWEVKKVPPQSPTQLKEQLRNMLFWALLSAFLLIEYTTIGVYYYHNREALSTIYDGDYRLAVLYIAMIAVAIGLFVTPLVQRLRHKTELANATLAINFTVITVVAAFIILNAASDLAGL